MPVTIDTLTSTVNVAEGSSLSNQAMEQIVRLVLARLKAELQAESLARESSQIPNRMSDTDPFSMDRRP